MSSRWIILEMAGSSICSMSLTVSLYFACRIDSGGKHGPKITSSTAEGWTPTETGKWNGVVSLVTLNFSWNLRRINLNHSLTCSARRLHTASWQGPPCSLSLMSSFLSINQCKPWIKYLYGDNNLCLMSFSLWWEVGGGFCWIIITPGGLWECSSYCTTDRHTEIWVVELRNTEKPSVALSREY